MNTKMYVDLSGYIEEGSIYNGFHYFISAVVAEGYSYFRGLRLRSQALMGLTKIFNESGVPHTVQIEVSTQSVEGDGKGDDRSNRIQDRVVVFGAQACRAHHQFNIAGIG